jgi:hypothetical protein
MLQTKLRSDPKRLSVAQRLDCGQQDLSSMLMCLRRPRRNSANAPRSTVFESRAAHLSK